MTRKEAIDIIKCLAWHTRPSEEDVKQAIKALEQEPKPMVEIDLYSVIKQKYIEREVFDKLRIEIIEKFWDCDICKYNDSGHFSIRGDINDILQIMDKYKAESEDKDENDD